VDVYCKRCGEPWDFYGAEMGKFPMGRIVLTRGVYEWATVNGGFYHFVSIEVCAPGQKETGATSVHKPKSRMSLP